MRNYNKAPEEEQGQLTSSAELRDIFNTTFPQQDEIVMAFGYGSGVFLQQEDSPATTKINNDAKSESSSHDKPPQPPQSSNNHNLATTPTAAAAAAGNERKMLDMILIVKDAYKFHSINTQLNPHHYSLLFGNPTRATWWQRHDLPRNSYLYNPKVLFNFVDDDACYMKYGVMEQGDLASDLQHWDSLYVAGRMHKPVATIMGSNNYTSHDEEGSRDNIDKLQRQYNLPAALSMAMLLSTVTTTKTTGGGGGSEQHLSSSTTINMSLPELYSRISTLSYTGDFRMQVGAEDPGKIDKLVHSPGQLNRFHDMYYETALHPLIQSGILSLVEPNNTVSSSNSTSTGNNELERYSICWNGNASAIRHLWQKLPTRFQYLRPCNHNNNAGGILGLQKELHRVVAPAARYQSFKGLWTAGLTKSARYALAKLSKGILRRR